MGLFDYLFICVAGFIAAAVDSIAGGGGLISLPAIMAVGVLPHSALGTNKFASTCASFTSTLTFAKSKKIYMPLIKFLIPCTLIGAALGVKIALKIDQTVLQVMVLVLIFAVAIYTMVKKRFRSKR
ncbi:MAG: TSUP family transporter [Lutisporaceae bacterium]